MLKKSQNFLCIYTKCFIYQTSLPTWLVLIYNKACLQLWPAEWDLRENMEYTPRSTCPHRPRQMSPTPKVDRQGKKLTIDGYYHGSEKGDPYFCCLKLPLPAVWSIFLSMWINVQRSISAWTGCWASMQSTYLVCLHYCSHCFFPWQFFFF